MADANILFVEDDLPFQRVLLRSLEDQGYSVTVCGTGPEALRLIPTKEFNAVLCDVRLHPQFTGLDLLRLLRLRDEDLPVIMITGGSSMTAIVRAVEHQAFRYLLKPFETQELLTALEQAVSLNRLAKAKREAFQTMRQKPALLNFTLTQTLQNLWPAFQPIVSAESKEVAAYEVLMRTEGSTLNNPGAVLDAAERLGRLPDLLQTVSSRALLATPINTTLFLNLHPNDLLDNILISGDLARRAPSIVLEITERDVVPNTEAIQDRLKHLRNLGYRLAIDDLGAGYAGLNSFTALEPELVKLDMELIRGITENPVKQRLVKVMAELCHDLGCLVVAEGIETKAERDKVVELGCDFLQGFHFGKPARGFEIPTW